jgi:hypothetical protein
MKKYMSLGFALVLTLNVAQFAIASPLGEHFNSNAASGLNFLGAMIVSLWDTPEPGSLFVLGGVLFSLALVVFWKAAKSSKEYGDAAMVRVEQPKSDSN